MGSVRLFRQPVCPVLHQGSVFRHVFGVIVGGVDLVLLYVRKLKVNDLVWEPLLVQVGGESAT